MPLQAGETFREIGSDNADPHWWIVVSDPGAFPDNLVVVNFTTLRPRKDQSCLIPSGYQLNDAVRFDCDKCVAYHFAKITTTEKLISRADRGEIEMPGRARAVILTRVREGAGRTRALPAGVKRELLRQGIIKEVGAFWLRPLDRA